MIRCFHEAPNSMFNAVQHYTSGDYALVHLFEENTEYFELFNKAVKDGREVILDNSIFELGTAFDSERYVYWIDKLNPTWFIAPDVLEDSEGTLESLAKFKVLYPNPKQKVIAVAQGKSMTEMVSCFLDLHDDPYVDMIGLSFDLSFYRASDESASKLEHWMQGRRSMVKFLNRFYEEGRCTKPVHLLGCALPQEGLAYKQGQYDWIYSVDTSNPVVAGFEYTRYNQNGLQSKSKTKLYTIIDAPTNITQREMIIANIKDFNNLWN